jgi:hypothetical protein
MSHTASTVDTLLIRPTHGDQTGAGNNERTHHSEGIQKSRSVNESRPLSPRPSLPINPTKSADPSLTVRYWRLSIRVDAVPRSIRQL